MKGQAVGVPLDLVRGPISQNTDYPLRHPGPPSEVVQASAKGFCQTTLRRPPSPSPNRPGTEEAERCHRAQRDHPLGGPQGGEFTGTLGQAVKNGVQHLKSAFPFESTEDNLDLTPVHVPDIIRT